MIGRLFKEEPSNCEGLEVRKLQSTQMSHAKIVAKSIEDIIDGAYALTYEIAQKTAIVLGISPSFGWNTTAIPISAIWRRTKKN